jgi:uncharacterized protein (TIGR00369 family)
MSVLAPLFFAAAFLFLNSSLVGSFASRYFINDKDVSIRGVEITTNHVKSISQGYVYAKASNIHMGRTMQIWEIKVTDESNNLISIGKLTTLAIKKK